MRKISVCVALVIVLLGAPALAQSGGDRFCKQYASGAADNAREAIRQNPSCLDPGKGMHSNESMHYMWCMTNPRSAVEGAFDNIRRLADNCTRRQAPPRGAAAPAPQQPVPQPSGANPSAQAGFRPDKPSAVRTVPPPPGGGEQITCTYFPDMMIRQAIEGPSAGKAMLVRGSNPPCSANPPRGTILDDTDNMAFSGRKGSALFFAGEPSGAGGFIVLDAQSAKVVFRDSLKWGENGPLISDARFENGGLKLRYKRGVNAPCSIMQNAARCWSQMIKEGLLPTDMAQQIPSPKICEAAYRQINAPKDSPTLVMYQNEIIVYGNGDMSVLSRGPVECDVVP